MLHAGAVLMMVPEVETLQGAGAVAGWLCPGAGMSLVL